MNEWRMIRRIPLSLKYWSFFSLTSKVINQSAYKRMQKSKLHNGRDDPSFIHSEYNIIRLTPLFLQLESYIAGRMSREIPINHDTSNSTKRQPKSSISCWSSSSQTLSSRASQNRVKWSLFSPISSRTRPFHPTLMPIFTVASIVSATFENTFLGTSRTLKVSISAQPNKLHRE